MIISFVVIEGPDQWLPIRADVVLGRKLHVGLELFRQLIVVC